MISPPTNASGSFMLSWFDMIVELMVMPNSCPNERTKPKKVICAHGRAREVGESQHVLSKTVGSDGSARRRAAVRA